MALRDGRPHCAAGLLEMTAVAVAAIGAESEEVVEALFHALAGAEEAELAHARGAGG